MMATPFLSSLPLGSAQALLPMSVCLSLRMWLLMCFYTKGQMLSMMVLIVIILRGTFGHIKLHLCRVLTGMLLASLLDFCLEDLGLGCCPAVLAGIFGVLAPTSLLVAPLLTMGEYAALFYAGGDSDPAYLAALSCLGTPDSVAVLMHLEPGAITEALGGAHIMDTDTQNPSGPKVPRKFTAVERAKFVQFLERCRKDAGFAPAFAHAVPMPSEATTPDKRKAKASHVLEQGVEGEFEILDETTLNHLWTEYEKPERVGRAPRPEQRPTIEQISGIHDRIKAKCFPFVDFAVFTPFARSTQKKQKLASQVMQNDGTFKPTSLPGARNFDEWLKGWEVFKTTMLLLQAASAATLDEYSSRVRELAKLYPDAWDLVAIADDMMRSTEIDNKVRSSRVTVSFNASLPAGSDWSAALAAAADDDRFWDKYVDKRAIERRTSSGWAGASSKVEASPAGIPSGQSPSKKMGCGKGKKDNKNAGNTRAGSVQECYNYQNGNGEGAVCPNKCARTGKPRLHICLKCRRAHSLPRGNDCRQFAPVVRI